jgi:hypothetical protein
VTSEGKKRRKVRCRRATMQEREVKKQAGGAKEEEVGEEGS